MRGVLFVGSRRNKPTPIPPVYYDNRLPVFLYHVVLGTGQSTGNKRDYQRWSLRRKWLIWAPRRSLPPGLTRLRQRQNTAACRRSSAVGRAAARGVSALGCYVMLHVRRSRLRFHSLRFALMPSNPFMARMRTYYVRPNMFGETKKRQHPPEVRSQDGHVEHVCTGSVYLFKTAWTFGLLCGEHAYFTYLLEITWFWCRIEFLRYVPLNI